MVQSATTSLPTAREGTLTDARAIVGAAATDSLLVRVLGGPAIALRCESARGAGPFARAYSDVDVVTSRQSAHALTRTLQSLGFQPEPRFNALHGHSRMIFAHPAGPHVDVFIEQFVMCHKLDLAPRLAVHDTTLPLADLLLTKLQVAKLNPKDVTDAGALLLDHPLSHDESGINIDYITDLLAHDWGWWRTMTENLRKVALHLPAGLERPATTTITQRIEQLIAAVDRAPKTIRWRARAKAGDRLPWRDEPEEAH